ncbi:LPS export ABC transporter permease LptF [Candidatus Hepatincolaceae symbiont of Richtersius coronifer]
MNILGLYLIKKTAISVILIVLTITLLLLLLQSLSFLNLILSRGFSISTLLYLSALAIPSLWVEILPFSLILGVIFIWNSMITNQEITIMQASGVTPATISLPFIYVGLAVSIISLFCVSYLIPQAKINYTKVRSIIANNYNLKLIEQGKFVELNNSLTFYVRSISGNVFNTIMIHSTGLNGKLATIFGETGYVDFDNNKVILLLENVSIEEYDLTNKTTSFINLDKYIFSIDTIRLIPEEIRNSVDKFYLTELLDYKNLSWTRSLAHDPVAYKNFAKAVQIEVLRRISNVLFPLFVTIIAAYFFTITAFKRSGYRITIYKTIFVALIFKVINFAFLFYTLSYLISVGVLIVLPIVLGSYMVFRVFFPPSLYMLHKRKFII